MAQFRGGALPHSDPTAHRAHRAVLREDLTDTVSINGGDIVRISRATAKALVSLLDIKFSPDDGEYFASITEEAAAFLAEDDGQTPSGGNRNE